MKVAVVTSTRAEYGILRPLIVKLNKIKEIELQLIVTGTHLSPKYGTTINEIERDGMPIYCSIPILVEGNLSTDISQIMANAIVGFAGYFEKEQPDCVFILGDRTEMLGICAAAMNAGVPICHIHGGELTEGAIDDCVRHAITKMSYLHFSSTEVYRKRIIQMGEDPERVFNVGSLGVENIIHTPLLTESELRNELAIRDGRELVAVTFHPVTMEKGREKDQVEQLIGAIEEKTGYYYVITKANADAGSDIVNRAMEDYCSSASNALFFSSLGMKRYLSLVKYSKFVLGNSSSGIIEAPSLGTPSINIGNRQKGRLMADSVICCEPYKNSILNAIGIAEKMEHRPSFLYGDGNTSDKIIDVILNCFDVRIRFPSKAFYDIDFEV